MLEKQALLLHKGIQKIINKWNLPNEQLDHFVKMRITKLNSKDVFFSYLRSYSSLEAEKTEYANCLKSAKTIEHAVVDMKLSKHSPAKVDRHPYQQEAWNQEQMS